MTAYDVRARAAAARALLPIAQGGKGQVVVVTTPFAGAIDPATDTMTAGAPTVRTGSGIVLEYSTFIRSGTRNESGSLIQAGDKQLLLSALGADGLPLDPPPAVNDTVALADGSKFTISSRAPLSPAGLDVFYDLNIRSA